MDRAALTEKILDYYSAWYDIDRCPETEAPMIASAAFHEHATSYMISKKAETWSTDRHEYAYFFSMPELTEEVYDACFAKAFALGEALVDPKPGHMCTSIAILFLADKVSDAVAAKLVKVKIRKNFQFSLKGWMEVHVAAVDTGAETVVTNPDARNEKIYFENVLHPRKHPASILGKLLSRR